MMSMILPITVLALTNSWNLSILVLPMLMLMNTTNLLNPSSHLLSMSPSFTLNNLSVMLISMTFWITMLMLMNSSKIVVNKMEEKKFLVITLSLCLVLTMAFSVSNMLSFYMLFEASLIPTLMLILMWGYQPERLQAGMYMMLYTVTASLPLLLSIITLLYSYKTVSFLMITIPAQINLILSITLMLAFLVKLPIYTLHLWLPKAHVEAPVAGSMILASILLKLGGYGLIQMIIMHHQILMLTSSLIISISMWGAALTTIMCIRQLDMKSMIAYSSVSHMALVIAGIFSNTMWGWEGAMMMMLAHGLSSSGLFALANMYYENTFTRSLFITKGLLFLTPSMTMWWMLMIAANMGTPPTINILAEIMLFTSIVFYSHFTLTLMMVITFFTTCYSLILYTSLHHGPPSGHLNFINPLQLFFTVNMLHSAPLFMMVLSPDQFSHWM